MCRLVPLLLLCACTIEIRVPRDPAPDPIPDFAPSDPHQPVACTPCTPACASHQSCINGTCYDKAVS